MKQFEDAAFTLKAGEVSDIVETRFGYHLIKVEQRHPAGTAALEEVKPQLERFLKDRKIKEAVRKYVEGLKGKAEVKRFVEDGPEKKGAAK